MAVSVRSDLEIAAGPAAGPSCGGGVLTVLLDLSVADRALHRAAEMAVPGASPLTVLAQVRRPPMPVGFPCVVVAPYWTDDGLLAEARRALNEPVDTLTGHGRVDLRLAFSDIEKLVVRLLRERDYAQVVIGSRNSLFRRRPCRRIESAAGAYCPVEVIQTGRRRDSR